MPLLTDEHEVIAIDQCLSGAAGIEGDIADEAVVRKVFAGGCDAVIHLATIPGGLAEQEPRLAKRVNIDATMSLLSAAAEAGSRPKFIFASSIAVYGDPLPHLVDDDTPIAPKMLYGSHKAMMEMWIETQSRRGAVQGISLRLPGIVARPKANTKMKSAFMSDVFHALKNGEEYCVPVSADATMWLMSAQQVAKNIKHALFVSDSALSINLPALRVRFADLVHQLARQLGQSPAIIRYDSDPAFEAAFGAQPALSTRMADSLGFCHDGSLDMLVASALSTIE